MKYVLKADEMKACDEYTINGIGIPSMVLMERAALSVVSALEERKIPLKGKKALIAAGTGNNGGDGLAIGRLLSRIGAEVTFYLEGNLQKLSVETKAQVRILKNMGFSILSKTEDDEYDMVVDALFGIGLSGEITGSFKEAIEKINRQKERGAFVCSVDIPSGICADTGRIYGCAVKADLTVAFAFAKRGHLLYPGRAYTGELAVADIGIPKAAFREAIPSGFYYGKEELSELLPGRSPWGNKGTFGKVLLLAGSHDMSGACILCGKAVLRTGAGMLKIITPDCNRKIVQQSLPEALLYTFEGRPDGEAVKKALLWADVVVAGPGMGCGEASYQLLSQVLESASHPMVIDADGLNLLAMHRELWELAEGHKDTLILTPHPGELMRLIKAASTEAASMQAGHQREASVQSAYPQSEASGALMTAYPANRETIIRGLAKELKAIVAAKDAATLVAEDGREEIFFNTSGNDGMAAAGSGDVLAGIIGGLAAQGMNGFESACLGVYLHGLAGDEARRKLGAYGMLAGDICESIPDVMRKASPV